MKRVLVGMSGGVDSAAAAYLLQKEGYEVCGVTLRTWDAGDGSESRCCEIDDAQRVAHRLGIRHYALNCVADFSGKVVDPFVRSYLEGQTPNPCIECNRYVKWEKMLYAAKVMEADYVATGHYAHVVRLANGRYTVKKAKHAAKDQTYMLYKLSQEQLAATLMPLGDYTKEEVRRIALEAGLPVAQKPDSQEICFVTDGHYADFIEQYAEKRNTEIVFDDEDSRLNKDSGCSVGSKEIGYNAGSKETGGSAGRKETGCNAGRKEIGCNAGRKETGCNAGSKEIGCNAGSKEIGYSSGSGADGLKVPGPGFFVDEAGNRLGTHKGITHYTIGQRKGLGIALGHPIYVKEIRADSNEVVLSDEPALFSREVLCRDVNFLSIPGIDPGQQIPAKAKIRYHHQAADAMLEMQADGCVRILFDDPVRAAAPGQSAVFYDADDCVIGGGIIVK